MHRKCAYVPLDKKLLHMQESAKMKLALQILVGIAAELWTDGSVRSTVDRTKKNMAIGTYREDCTELISITRYVPWRPSSMNLVLGPSLHHTALRWGTYVSSHIPPYTLRYVYWEYIYNIMYVRKYYVLRTSNVDRRPNRVPR